MARRWTNDMSIEDVTPRGAWLGRRGVLRGGGALAAGLGTGLAPGLARAQADGGDLEPNTLEEITSYNNFYEFGPGKGDPAEHAPAMETEPWTVRIEGLVDEPGEYSVAELVEGLEIEERIYRQRCVETWSRVVPWNGYELADVLGRLGPREEARYVEFETAVIPEVMPGVRAGVLDFPYIEALRIDEAMHPLAMLVTGLYGEPLPEQNGAPVRIVVPWKYGFKSAKSLVRIAFVAERPETTWNVLSPREYGFFANVNPEVDHPRWSQATEKRVGGGLFARRIPTLMFNGYDEVASLYEGMDLAENF